MSGWVAGAVVGGSVISGLVSSDASRKASNAQVNASNQSNQTQLDMYNQTRADQAPWRQAGSTALGQLSAFTGAPTTNADGTVTPGDPNAPGLHQFTTADLNGQLAPNYQFIKDQGLGAINNQASVGGGLVGGNALKGIVDYSNNLAGNAYQQAYNNYNTNQTNIFNRLSSIAGLGQTSVGQTAQAGATTAGNIGSGLMAGGAANAAGIVGSANAITGGLNNAGSMWLSNNLTGGRLFGNGGNSAMPADPHAWPGTGG